MRRMNERNLLALTLNFIGWWIVVRSPHKCVMVKLVKRFFRIFIDWWPSPTNPIFRNQFTWRCINNRRVLAFNRSASFSCERWNIKISCQLLSQLVIVSTTLFWLNARSFALLSARQWRENRIEFKSRVVGQGLIVGIEISEMNLWKFLKILFCTKHNLTSTPLPVLR